MRCETVGTEKRKRLVGVSLNTINYKHGARGEITYFNHRAKRVKHMRLYLGLAIVAHAQYSELNELRWCRWLRLRILNDNDYFQPFS